MKKFLNICLIIGVCIGLSGCGSGKPTDLSDDNYELGIKILETVDKYLDGDLNASDAKTKIDILNDRIDTKDIKGTTKASFLSIQIASLSHEILKSENGAFGGDIKVVEEKRKEVAKILGK